MKAYGNLCCRFLGRDLVLVLIHTLALFVCISIYGGDTRCPGGVDKIEDFVRLAGSICRRWLILPESLVFGISVVQAVISAGSLSDKVNTIFGHRLFMYLMTSLSIRVFAPSAASPVDTVMRNVKGIACPFASATNA